MKSIRATVKAWSREDLERTVMAMMKIAGWALALVWTAYIVRFTSILGPIHSFFFGAETVDQIANAKAAWGQFGDFVGGTLNPMVSLLALVGLVFTILLQHEAMIGVQRDAAASQKALSDQTRLTLEAARLQSLAAALEVTTEMHRQAVETKHISAKELLKRKEGLAEQILEINERLAMQVQAVDAEALTGAA